ncbi:hypothetical protein NUACC26_100880 [Scytonema sp. NUACC26]
MSGTVQDTKQKPKHLVPTGEQRLDKMRTALPLSGHGTSVDESLDPKLNIAT